MSRYENYLSLHSDDRLRAGVDAVDLLNSYVRSKSGVWAPKKAIYFLKNEAILATHRAGWNTYRPVEVSVKCRNCGGTGQYTSWDGDTFDHCRACMSTGMAFLRFIETTIEGRLIWHTPAAHWPHKLAAVRPVFTAEGEGWQGPGTWAPNAPGRDLDIFEAIDALNIAEIQFPDRPGGFVGRYGSDADIFAYTLYLGRVFPLACALCRRYYFGDGARIEDPEFRSLRVHRDRFAWSDLVCERCTRGLSVSALLDRMPDRPTLVNHPSVLVWAERQARMNLRPERKR